MHAVLALVSTGRQQGEHWNVMKIGNPAIFVCRTDLVECKWGRTAQVSRKEAREKVL